MKRLVTAVLAVAALFLLPASAMAKDRNHDRIPDKWEKRHHLSLHANQARTDQERDGLRNLAEFRQHTDPRDADTDNDGLEDGDEHKLGHDATDDDSDHDGIEDGDENTGTVKSFAGGVLTIAHAGGGELSGAVTDATEIECATGDDEGDDHEDGGDRVATASDDGEGEHCSTDALVAGAVVKEAEVETEHGSATFHDVKLLG